MTDVYTSSSSIEGLVDRKHRMLEGVARILSENYGVDIIFSPDGECCTNEEKMILPYDKALDEALVLGLCGHETGHLRDTDFTVPHKIGYHEEIANKGLLFSITNALEDVRIEIIMEEAYPGFKDLFHRMIPYIQDKFGGLLRREQMAKEMSADGKSKTAIEAALEKDKVEEISKAIAELEEAQVDDEFVEHEVERIRQLQDTVIPQIKQILDVMYLRLRDYDVNWYPQDIVDFVDEMIIDTAKEVYDCENTSQVLTVAEKVYKILEGDDQAREENEEKKGEDEDDKDNGDSEQSDDKGKGGSTKGEEEEDEEGGGKGNEDEEDESEPKPSAVLGDKQITVGTQVRHLNNPNQTGEVVDIQAKGKEIDVKWDKDNSKELFKGINRRFLIPFGELEEGDRSQDTSPPKKNRSGFDDTITIQDGSQGAGSPGGGVAKGKTKIQMSKELEELDKELQKQVDDIIMCTELVTLKDGVKEIVKEVFNRTKALSKAEQKYTYSVAPIVDQKPKDTEYEVDKASLPQYMKIENSVKKPIHVIESKLRAIVANESYARWVAGANHGKRICRRRIARIPFGERDFFKTKVESDIRDVAFMLLVDESGSMYGQKASEARRCGVAFGRILDKLAVPFEIIGFTTTDLTPAQQTAMRAKGYDDTVWNRAENLRHNMYKRFNESYQQVKTRLVNIAACAENFDQDDLEFGWNRLLQYCLHNCIQRKVIIVISDGQPCGGAEGREKLRKLINLISCDPNADIIGIGVQTQYVKDFYPKCVEIQNVSQLGMNVVNLLYDSFAPNTRRRTRR